MIVCEECGSANEPGARFCGNCSSYLAWADATDATAEPPVLAPVDAQPQPEQGAPPLVGSGREEVAPVGDTAVAEVAVEEAPPAAVAGVEEALIEEALVEPGPVEEPAPVAEAVEEAPVEEAARVHEAAPVVEEAPVEKSAPVEGPGPIEAAVQEAPVEAAVVEAEAEEPPVQERARVPEPAPVVEAAPVEEPAPVRTPPLLTAASEPAPMPRMDPDSGTPAARSDATGAPMTPAAKKPSRDQVAAEEARRKATAAAMLRPVKPAAAASPAPTQPGPAQEAAAASVGATPPGTAPARKPQARKPGEAEPRRTPPPKPDDEPEAQPGDLICGNCGAGNVATRKFCRRCGTSLEQAVVMPSQPWYRRIFTRRPKQPKVAGSRPAKLHSDSQRAALRVRRWVAILAGLGLVGAAVWFLRPMVGGVIDKVQDRASDQVQVTPADAEATSSTRGHRAARTRDGHSNTYWEAGESGEASGVSLDYRFDEPFRLVTLLMIPGASKDQAEFLQHGRPADVRVTLTTSTGEEVDKTWEIPNEPGDQVLDIGVDDVEQVRLTIASSYVDEGQRVAIAEVEFRTRE